jgi:outer membrane protein OmpA-like peptidoglycan-associated protein
MSDQNDESQNYALMVVAGVIALVIGGVLTLALRQGLGGSAQARGASTESAKVRGASAGAALGVDAPAGLVYFALESSALPAEASDELARIADAARAQAGALVLISGFHDASGDAAANAELAKQRALAVRHALEANGVAPDRLILDKPSATAGGADAREARRVEMHLR